MQSPVRNEFTFLGVWLENKAFKHSSIGKMRPVAYASKSLTPGEPKYVTHGVHHSLGPNYPCHCLKF